MLGILFKLTGNGGRGGLYAGRRKQRAGERPSGKDKKTASGRSPRRTLIKPLRREKKNATITVDVKNRKEGKK